MIQSPQYNPLQHFAGLYIFSGFVACIFQAAKLTISFRKKENLTEVTLIFLVSSLLLLEVYLSNFADTNLILPVYPYSATALILIKNLKFLIGPLVLMLYGRITAFKDEKRKFSFAHFIIPSLIYTVEIYTSEFAGNKILCVFRTESSDLIREIAGLLHMAAYMIFIIIKVSVHMRYYTSSLKKHVINFVVISGVIIFSILLMPVFWIFGADVFKTFFFILITSLMFAMIFIPEFGIAEINSAAGEIAKVRYSRTLLSNIDTESLGENLLRLMEKDKIYLDENLSLSGLAEILDLTPHQLSEFINLHMGKNFNVFINSFRVAESKKILSGTDRISILDAAFASGFNSKTSFYSAFSEATGMTPKDFRRLHNRKSAS